MRYARLIKPRPLAFLLLMLAGGCSTVGTRVTGVDNFALVEDGLYRGAQPSQLGVAQLKETGVRTVIDLRDDRNPAERAWVEAAGMTYVNIPTNAAVVEPGKIAAFLDAVKDARRPVFVHCRRGRDRTGLEIAVYRIVEQEWSREAALKELYAHGHQWLAFPGIARYVKSFDAEQYRKAADAGG